jgi:putative sporulation protein YyaC
MNYAADKCKEATYISSGIVNGAERFSEDFTRRLEGRRRHFKELVFLCIGSDRATGDCLGPIVGQSLSAMKVRLFNMKVYGSLENPVHAVNLDSIMGRIYRENEKPLIVAIDAAVGRSEENVGFIVIGSGPVKPGASVNKNLPVVGDMFISGIVNTCVGGNSITVIQNTRLNTVMNMAEVISNGIKLGLERTFAMFFV